VAVVVAVVVLTEPEPVEVPTLTAVTGRMLNVESPVLAG